MIEHKPAKPKKAKLLALSIAILVLCGMSTLFLIDWVKLTSREQDTPPVIEFTWTPIGPVDLKEMRGFLKITDDYGLDFTSYRMTVLELDRSFDMPIEGLIGREYESPISLSLLADNEQVVGRRKLTLLFEIADDRGQSASLERTIHIKPRTDDPGIRLLTADDSVQPEMDIVSFEVE